MQTYLIIGVAALLAIIGSFFYGNHTGAKTEAAKWLKRENVELVAANAKIIEITVRNRAIEQKAAQDMTAVAVKLQKENLNGLAKKDRVIADLRSGALKLRICPASEAAAGVAGPAVASSGQRDNAGQGAYLSRPRVETLIGIANEADDLVRTLTACQAVIQADRKAVNLQ